MEGSVHTELLPMALALAVIANNGYSTHFIASLSLRVQCERNLRGIVVSPGTLVFIYHFKNYGLRKNQLIHVVVSS